MASTGQSGHATETVKGIYGPITFLSADRVIGAALRRYGEWAENEIRFLVNFIPEGGTVLDIGGFIGTHALAFSHMVGPAGTVHCFEPQPVPFELLAANVTANGRDQIVLHRAAVGEMPGQLALEPPVIGLETNGVGPSIGGGRAEWAGAGLIDVETIDALGLAACHVIKCDVEGMEPSVLRGGTRTIRALRPVIYCQANTLDGAVKTTQTLWQLGYRVYAHVVDVFNPGNFFGSAQNIFGDAREIGLVGVMPEHEGKLRDLSRSCWDIYPVETLDDLAYAMLQKPHYVDEVLRAGRATGGSVVSWPQYRSILDELETVRRQAEIAQEQLLRIRPEFHESLARSRREAEELSTLRQGVARLGRQLQASEQRAERLSRELRRLRRSNILRVFRSLIDKEMNFRDWLKQLRAARKAVAARDAGAAAGTSKAVPSAPAGHPITLATIGRGLAPADEVSAKPVMLFVAHVSPASPRARNAYRVARLLRVIKGLGIQPILLLAPLPGEEFAADSVETVCAAFDDVIIIDRDGILYCQLAHRVASEVLRRLEGQLITDFREALGEKGRKSRILPVSRTFSPDLLVDVLTRLESALSPFCIMVNSCVMARSFPLLRPATLKVIDTHDIFATTDLRGARFGLEASLCLTRAEEATLMRSADLLLAGQPDKISDLAALSGGTPVITAGLDMSPPAVDMPPVEAPTLLMVASANAMNGKGLRDFVRFAWPIIRETVPEAELHVAGDVGQELTGHEPGVTALGSVDDLTPLYRRSRVVINPAVAGTGIKIKTLEALNHLRPIVLWPSGLDGLHPDLAKHCVCVRDWFQYAEAVINLLKSTDVADELQASRDQIWHLLSEDVNFSDFKGAFENRIGTWRR